MIPKRVLGGVRKTGIKTSLYQLPTLITANLLSKLLGVVIGIDTTEDSFGGTIEILSINKGDGFGRRSWRGLRTHLELIGVQKITPPEAFIPEGNRAWSGEEVALE